MTTGYDTFLVVVPGLVVGSFLFMFVADILEAPYATCYHSAWRPPQQERWRVLLSLCTMSFTLSLLFACTGGGLGFLITGDAPSFEILKRGAIVGAFVFAAGRTWALTRAHSLAESLYLTIPLAFGAFIAAGTVDRGIWTLVSDRILKADTDVLALAPSCGVYACVAVLASELASRGYDRWISKNGPITPFSLSRAKIESQECYPRITGEHAIIRAITEALEEAQVVARSENRTVSICWLNAYAPIQLCNHLKNLLNQNALTDLRIISHDSPTARRNLSGFEVGRQVRFMRIAGSMRVFLINDSRAFLGIQVGKGRQEHYPDYNVSIDEPSRLAWLKVSFDEQWKAAGTRSFHRDHEL